MKKKGRILIIIGYGELGGAERQAIYLAEGLKNKGYKVFVLNFGNKGRSNEILDQKKVANDNITLRLTYNKRDIIKDLTKLYFKILSFLPNTIFPFTRNPNVYVNALCPFLPFTKTFWNQREEGRGIYQNKLEKFAIRNTHQFISNSTIGADFLNKTFHVPREKITIIYNGVEVQKKDHNINEKLNVGMIGNLHAYKDYHTLLKGWHFFKRQNPGIELQLFIAGRNDGLLDSLNQIAEELHISDSVKFVGQVETIREFIRSLTIGIHSSLHEGCPNAVLEMMSHGLPVVASNIPGNIDALGSDYPLFFEAGNADDLAKQFSCLVNSRSCWEEIGNRNQERIKEHFTVPNMINQYENLLQ